MLTLKIISTNIDGLVETNIFSAQSLSHSECEFVAGENNECFDDKVISVKLPEVDHIIGGMNNTHTTQHLSYSTVKLYVNGEPETILITPKSEVYIMQDGKTVDMFVVQYFVE